MDMTGEYRIAAPRAKVWAALNDPEILKQSIPGCEEVIKNSDTELEAKVTAKVGPVKARFGGKVTLSDLDPPNGYRISGEGSGGAAGFAKGGANVHLVDDGDGTLLTYTVEAHVGGKLAQIGSRLIDATARKMAGEFFSRFAEIVGDAQAASAAPEPSSAGAAATPAAALAQADIAPAPIPVAPAPISVAPPPRPAASAAPQRGRFSPIVWVMLLAAAVALLLYMFTGTKGG